MTSGELSAFDPSNFSAGTPTVSSPAPTTDAEVPRARAAGAADAGAPRRAVQSGIERRRALTADANVPESAAHVELPLVRAAAPSALGEILGTAVGGTRAATIADLERPVGTAGGGILRDYVVADRVRPEAASHDAFRLATAAVDAARADAPRPRLAGALHAGPTADVAPTFANVVAGLLFGGPLDETLADQPALEGEVLDQARRLAARAYPADRVSDRSTDRWVDHAARDELHRALLACYQPHVRLPHHGMSENQLHPFALRLLHVLEASWERDLLARARRSAQRAVGDSLTEDDLPADPKAFCEWFKRAAFTHPLYEHPLYGFLAGEATREQLERFLRLESAGEAAFDDLVALGQVGTRGEVKIEMGRNYWDELGNGKSHAVHTHLFHRMTETLDLTAPEAHELPWQVLGGVNVMLWSCIPRRNAFRAQGTLGAVELLAPQRCTRLTAGAARVGIPKKAMIYYAAHAIVDVGHAEGWLEHVVRPQVTETPAARVGIAEGLMARADASLDYFDYASGLLRN